MVPKTVGVLVAADHAAGTLTRTLDRIPPDFRDRIDEIIIVDGAEGDGAFEAGTDWVRRHHLLRTTVLRHTRCPGHGGSRKAAYRLAIECGLDVVVLLHADGRYPPEALPDLVGPLLRDEADAVFGARTRAGATYRQMGETALTYAANRLLGTSLCDFCSGYRAYGTAALRGIPCEHNSDGADFDAQVTVQLAHAGRRILEVPVPAGDEDEPRDAGGLSYARDVLRDLLEYRRVRIGFGTSDWVPAPRDDRSREEGRGDAHEALLAELTKCSPGRVLDLGCSSGRFAERARALGHRVVGVDRREIEGVGDRVSLFVCADLEEGIPADARVAGGYDMVVAADVLQCLARPDRLLREIHGVLRPGGQLLVSVPNGVHWYPRLRFATGRFGYDRRGILDEDHLRFFSRASLRRLLAGTGYRVLDEHNGGLPLRALGERARTGGSGGDPRTGGRLRAGAGWLLTSVDRALARHLPNLFAYQLIARLAPRDEDAAGLPGPADQAFGPRRGTVPAQSRGAGDRIVEI